MAQPIIVNPVTDFAEGWSAGDPIPEYYRDSNRQVTLRGFAAAAAPSIPEVMFTLPPGYRPGRAIWFWIGVQELLVDVNGEVSLTLNPTYTDPPGVNVTGVQFLATL